MPAIEIRGEMELKIEGKTYILSLPFRELISMEKLLGRGVLEIAAGIGGPLQAEDVAHILRAGLAGGGYEFTLEQIYAHCDALGYVPSINAADALLAVTIHRGIAKKADGEGSIEEDPPRPLSSKKAA